MAGTTRVVHQVRCRSQSNPQLFADVEVLDAIAYVASDGTSIVMGFTPKMGVTVTPYIIDTTGGNNAKGNQSSFTRISHMERMTAQGDSSQIVDVEILDGLNLQPPQTFTGNAGGDSDSDDDQSTPNGFIDDGDVNSAQHALIMPSSKAVTAVADTTGMNLSVPANTSTTRVGHINVVTNAGDTDDKTQFSDNVTDTFPPTAHPFLTTIVLDGINFTLADGNTIGFLFPRPGVDGSADVTQDTTIYGTDPHTGDTHAPPDNTDANVYVSFPENSSGAALGSNPQSAQTGHSGPINQGYLWQIKKISGGVNPWFWWSPIQTPLAFSFFGSPPVSTPVKWGYRGFQLLNYYPVIWILSVNNPLQLMGSFGASDLQVAATQGDFDTQGSIPTAPIYQGGAFAGEVFAPFGYLPVLDPPLATVGLNFQIAVPNIWELTGITQPNLTNKNKPWSRVGNPYQFPTPSVWEEAANTFATNWDSVANGVNHALIGLDHTPWPIGNPPPGWQWATPWVWPHGSGGFPFPTFGAFQNGIQPGLIDKNGNLSIPPEVLTPATVATLNVSQLDPKLWDTRPCLVQDEGKQVGPYQLFGPPVLRS